MKQFTSTSLVAALALCSARFAFAQDAPVLPEPAASTAPAAPAVPLLDGLSQRIKSAVAQFKLAQVEPLEVERDALAQAKAALDAVAADADASVTLAQAAAEPYVARVFGKSPARSLVIQSSKADRSEQGEIEEDLAVMSHLFEKAIGKAGAGGPRAVRASGINVYSMSGAQPIQSLYLEGYGALFLMNAKFPLLAPPVKKEEAKAEESRDSDWDDARRELFGPGDGDFFVKVRKDFQPGEEFDADKVNSLRDALLESLKNGGNIRHLKPEEFITVTVIGPGSGAAIVRRQARTPGSAFNSFNWDKDVFKTVGRGDTVMTIRVKKADADAFAKNKLNLEEFRGKANIQTYTGGGGARSAQILRAPEYHAPDNVPAAVPRARSGGKPKPAKPAPDAPASTPAPKF
jgi:hypothetical protein